jgi:phosphatidylserine/phosphatidylglycerophosphate/cardiolipin synthase-like enzyme
MGMNTARGEVPRRGDGYDYDCDELHEVDMYSHQKYLTISGHYGDDRSGSYIFTGSSNWTHSGISGDEMILRAKGANLVKRWNRNFDFIWTKRSRPVGTNSGSGGFYPLSTCPDDGDAARATGRRAAEPSELRFAGPHWESD